MKTTLFALTALLATSIAHAGPFAGADAAAGSDLHADQCVACHSARFGGPEGSEIYTRANRKINTPSALTQQITACTTMLNLGLFPEDELNIAAYLNRQYYKFE